jgi:transcriptional regulator GlxA family with amidase domain
VPIDYVVAHRPGDWLAGSALRGDIPWPASLEGTLFGSVKEGRLAHLAPYIVDLFCSGHTDEETMRNLAGLLVREIALAANEHFRGPRRSLPAPLRKIQEHIHSHGSARLTVGELAQAGGCGEATIYRLFERFMGTTPHRFIARERVREASRLLRVTPDSIRQIGARVGFDDPFHFSRFFKKETGVSPRAYREQLSLL